VLHISPPPEGRDAPGGSKDAGVLSSSVRPLRICPPTPEEMGAMEGGESSGSGDAKSGVGGLREKVVTAL